MGRASPQMKPELGIPNNATAFCFGGQGHEVAEDISSFSWQRLKDAWRKCEGLENDLVHLYAHRNLCPNTRESSLVALLTTPTYLNETLMIEPKTPKRDTSMSAENVLTLTL